MATISKKKRIMESKDASKKRKAVAKTHKKKVEDQSDFGSCTTNEGLRLVNKNPHNPETYALRKVLNVKDVTAGLETTNGGSRSSSNVNHSLSCLTSSTNSNSDSKNSEDGHLIRNVKAAPSGYTTTMYLDTD